MDILFLCVVIFLFLLAVFDLSVGVSNDAVNFLNSAIGSRAASFKRVMIVAAIRSHRLPHLWLYSRCLPALAGYRFASTPNRPMRYQSDCEISTSGLCFTFSLELTID